LCTKEELEKAIEEGIKPIVERTMNLEDTVFGEDWDGGLKGWANRQDGYLKGIKTMLNWGFPILTAINVVILVAILSHLSGNPG